MDRARQMWEKIAQELYLLSRKVATLEAHQKQTVQTQQQVDKLISSHSNFEDKWTQKVDKLISSHNDFEDK